jgi:hypothetical protein
MDKNKDLLRRLRKPGDQIWIDRPDRIRKTSYGVRYYDIILYRMCDDGEIREVGIKHFDPDDGEFIKPL